MTTPSSVNLFDNIDPHRHLPASTRAAFWEACERVRRNPAEFADAVTWLDREYSEEVLRPRLLKDSKRVYREDLKRIAWGVDACDTLRRRRALRHGTPREVLVRQTIEIALSRGRWLLGNECIIPPNEEAAKAQGAVRVNKIKVPIVWRWLDQKRKTSAHTAAEVRQKRDANYRRQLQDWTWRYERAVEEVVNDKLFATRAEENARKIIVLACIAVDHRDPLPLRSEFCKHSWASEGSAYAMLLPELRHTGTPYKPGRETILFRPFQPHTAERLNTASIGAVALHDFSGGKMTITNFTDYLKRALNVLAMSVVDAGPRAGIDSAKEERHKCAGKRKSGRPRLSKTKKASYRRIVADWKASGEKKAAWCQGHKRPTIGELDAGLQCIRRNKKPHNKTPVKR